ncbi:MAG: hypothetical protein RIC85_04875, partial [Gammaproteobacteria bacterium]
GSETPEGSEDTDLVVDGDVDLAGTDVADVDADVPLDPVEAVVGDVDLDLDAGADLLNAGGADLLNAGSETPDIALVKRRWCVQPGENILRPGVFIEDRKTGLDASRFIAR